MKVKPGKANKESALELKYCERCGGLWLRPAGGGQIYCTICARAMAELPPASREVKKRMASKSDWELEEGVEGYAVSEIEVEEAGGAA
jgi:hypothetical protein